MQASTCQYSGQLDFPPAGFVGSAVNPDPSDASPHLRCGYGKCYKCNCQGFEGNAGTCANGGCGHAYGDHW